MNKKLIL